MKNSNQLTLEILKKEYSEKRQAHKALQLKINTLANECIKSCLESLPFINFEVSVADNGITFNYLRAQFGYTHEFNLYNRANFMERSYKFDFELTYSSGRTDFGKSEGGELIMLIGEIGKLMYFKSPVISVLGDLVLQIIKSEEQNLYPIRSAIQDLEQKIKKEQLEIFDKEAEKMIVKDNVINLQLRVAFKGMKRSAEIDETEILNVTPKFVEAKFKKSTGYANTERIKREDFKRLIVNALEAKEIVLS